MFNNDNTDDDSDEEEQGFGIGMMDPAEQARQQSRQAKFNGYILLTMAAIIGAAAWGSANGYVELWHVLGVVALYVAVSAAQSFYAARRVSSQIPEIMEQQAEMEEQLGDMQGLGDLEEMFNEDGEQQ